MQNQTKALTPEPLLGLPTGAFHFCQFALTRWREEPAAQGGAASGSSNREGSGREPRQGRCGGRSGDLRSTSDGVDPDRDVQEEPWEESGGRGLFGGEGEARTQLSENAELVGEGTGVAPAATVPTEENLSSGSFAENTMLAACSEQHSVSAAIAPVHARVCLDEAHGACVFLSIAVGFSRD